MASSSCPLEAPVDAGFTLSPSIKLRPLQLFWGNVSFKKSPHPFLLLLIPRMDLFVEAKHQKSSVYTWCFVNQVPEGEISRDKLTDWL